MKYEEWDNLYLKGESFFFCSVLSIFDFDCRYLSDDYKLLGQFFKKQGRGLNVICCISVLCREGDIRSIGFIFIRFNFGFF